MEIVKTTTTLNVEGLSEYIRRYEYPTGIIDWVVLSPRKEYKLENGEWSLFNEETWQYEPLKEPNPTWEGEYQELLLSQYPFEKRVREIAENNTDVSEVMFDLARDFNFVQLIKKLLR
jgi:hypothetical protein